MVIFTIEGFQVELAYRRLMGINEIEVSSSINGADLCLEGWDTRYKKGINNVRRAETRREGRRGTRRREARDSRFPTGCVPASQKHEGIATHEGIEA